jgi:hypothetical protein
MLLNIDVDVVGFALGDAGTIEEDVSFARSKTGGFASFICVLKSPPIATLGITGVVDDMGTTFVFGCTGNTLDFDILSPSIALLLDICQPSNPSYKRGIPANAREITIVANKKTMDVHFFAEIPKTIVLYIL